MTEQAATTAPGAGGAALEAPRGAAGGRDRFVAGAVAWRPALLAALLAAGVYRAVTAAYALRVAWGSEALGRVAADPAVALLPWAHWDAGWYVNIARLGYRALADGSLTSGNDGTAFAPGFPLVIAATAAVLHLPPLAAAMLVTLVSLVAALVLLYRLVELDHGDAPARLALVLLLLLPGAFFLAAPYTEAPLLACSVGALLAARHRRWWLAGALAGLAAFTKVYAAIIVVPLLVELYLQAGRSPRELARGAAAVVAGPLLALGAWAAYLWATFGSPLRFLTAQQTWGRELLFPGQPIWREVKALVGGGLLSQDLGLVSAIDLVAIVVIGAATVCAAWRMRRSYAAYLGGNFLLLASLTAPAPLYLYSVNRFATVQFPIVIAMSTLLYRRLWLMAVVAVPMVTLQVWLLTRFVQDRWAG